ncbi:MAG: replication initiation protein [Candidatus Riflebacteria bacterium]|nr:replication initiation protein [Candidatus Riflebacteria bacterium]
MSSILKLISLNITVHLRSTYSIKIYELLKRFENLKEAVFHLDKLKDILGVNEHEYILYGHFKSKVILVAQKELLEKTDIAFTFEEIKDGKKVSEIRFFIHKNDPKRKFLELPLPSAFDCEEPISKRPKPEIQLPQSQPQNVTDDTEENFFRLIAMLPLKYQKMKSIQNIIRRYLRKYGFDHVVRNINYTNVKSNAAKPGINPGEKANYGVYLSKSLAGDFGLPFQENEEVKAAEKALAEQNRREEEEKKRKEAETQIKDAANRAKADVIIQTLSESE